MIRALTLGFIAVLPLQLIATEDAGTPFHNVGGFVAGTIVQTAEGPTTIQNIRVNDRVLCLDVQTGRVAKRRVLKVGRAKVEELAKIVVQGETFYVNPDHRLYTTETKEWVRVRDLIRESHTLMNREGEHLTIERVELILRRDTIYDFKVEDFENYFVGKNHLLVHNFAFVIPIFTWVIGEGFVFFAGAALATAASVAIVMTANAALEEIQSRNQPPTRYDEAKPPRTRSDPLPRDPRTKQPVPDPDAVGVPHSQLGTKQGSKGPYPQAREFDGNGKPVRDIDFTNHGRPQSHPNPHQHRYEPNPTGGTMSRGKKGEPLWTWN